MRISSTKQSRTDTTNKNSNIQSSQMKMNVNTPKQNKENVKGTPIQK